jgi:hypothetical protein
VRLGLKGSAFGPSFVVLGSGVMALVLRLECDRVDCANAVEVPIGPDQTPGEVVAAEGWGLVRLGDEEVLRCPEHPLRQGLIRPTPAAA